MTFSQIFFGTVLAAAIMSAAVKGGRDERLAAFALVLAAIASPILVANSYGRPEVGLVIVDIGLFMALATIALRSRQFWPMWAAGFQLGALAVHLAAAKLPHMMPAAYADTLAIWSYLVVFAVLTGVWLETRYEHGRG